MSGSGITNVKSTTDKTLILSTYLNQIESGAGSAGRRFFLPTLCTADTDLLVALCMHTALHHLYKYILKLLGVKTACREDQIITDRTSPQRNLAWDILTNHVFLVKHQSLLFQLVQDNIEI